ncbi:MAG: hypothetical protein WBO45_24030 [Planctomycetota bacterium]
MRPSTALRAIPFLLALPLAAQDMIGVTFQGQVLHLHSATGAATVIASGLSGKNGLAFTNDNRLWTTVRSGTPGNFLIHLAVLDPFTGAESLPFGQQGYGDLRALAADALGGLMAVRDTGLGNVDELVRIDTTTGALTVLGPTGFTGIQGLDLTGAGPRAWDAASGLLLISFATGVASDPFPNVGGPANMQYLATDPATGRKFVGRDVLYEVNTSTGLTTQQVVIAGNPDLRGVEFLTARGQLYGTGCGGVPGLALAAAFGPGQPMSVFSSLHTPGAVGLEILGASDTIHAGLPLPLALDPLLGTSGCQLRSSVELTILGVVNGTGNLLVTVALPASLAFRQFFVQHAVLEPGLPGGLSFSPGLRVRSSMF